MSYRWIALAGALALTSLATLEAQTKSKTWTVPRTPDGHPDLQGVWTNATLTPMERPATRSGKADVDRRRSHGVGEERPSRT